MKNNPEEKVSGEELQKKAEAINNAFLREKQAETVEKIDSKEIDSRVESMLADIPKEELREEAREMIELIMESSRDDKTKLRLCEKTCKHILLSYMDNREYLGLPNRKFVEYKIFRHLTDTIEKRGLKPETLNTVARVNFDMNGLRFMNDVGGHTSGNIGLNIFGSILKEGKTVNWLKEQGIEVSPAAEGGDEFGLILYGEVDLRTLLPEIEKRFLEEVSSIRTINTLKIVREFDEKRGQLRKKLTTEKSNVDDIIKFNNPAHVKKMIELGVIDNNDKKIPEGFKFQLTTSVGSATFGEALGVADLENVMGYREMIDRVVNKMFVVADARAIIEKNEAKEKLKIENPTLFRMVNRVSPEVAELNKRLLELAKRLEEQTANTKEERQRREEAEKQILILKQKLLKIELNKKEVTE